MSITHETVLTENGVLDQFFHMKLLKISATCLQNAINVDTIFLIQIFKTYKDPKEPTGKIFKILGIF